MLSYNIWDYECNIENMITWDYECIDVSHFNRNFLIILHFTNEESFAETWL